VARLRITYNAPVVLTFALAATLVHVINGGPSSWFAAWPEFHDARSYVGLFSHILGHGNWDHLLSNFTMILLLGPILEERHGSLSLLLMIAITALITGLINVTFSSHPLIGASGIVFMMILLASTANIRAGEIPLTFIAVTVLFLGREVIAAFEDDRVSQMAHIVGGLAGAAYGFLTAAPGGSAPLGGGSRPLITPRPGPRPTASSTPSSATPGGRGDKPAIAP
jgi:membrane associated rhomboid family serine protease